MRLKPIPRPTLHATGQSVVRLDGRDHYLGTFGSPEADAKYSRLIASWLSNGRQLPEISARTTVNEIVLAYLTFAESHYRRSERGTNPEVECIKLAVRLLRRQYGRTPVAEFGPKALRIVRDAMIHEDWSRRFVNHQVNRLRRMFKWAVAEELVPRELFHGLQALEPLRMGAAGTRDPEPIKPVPESLIEAALPFMAGPVAAMVQLQLLTGARPGEIVAMRSCELDTSGPVWVFRPARHKERLAHGVSRASDTHGQPTPGAIERACDSANPPPLRLARHGKETIGAWLVRLTPEQRRELAAWRATRRWSPNRLRHNAATRIRKEHGVELARIILGHSSAFTTEIYADIDRRQALDVIAKIG